MNIKTLEYSGSWEIYITSYKSGGTTYEGENLTYAEIASKDKTIIYIKTKVETSWHIEVRIGGEVVNLYSETVTVIPFDASDLIQAQESDTIPIVIFGETLTGLSMQRKFILYRLNGFHYADFARQMQKAPNEIAGNKYGVTYNANSGSFVILPALINFYAPFVETGENYPFGVASKILKFPFWCSSYGNQNIAVSDLLGTNIANVGANSNNSINLNFTNAQFGKLRWVVTDTMFQEVMPRKMKCTEKYIMIKFVSPYAPYRTTNGTTKQEGIFILKLMSVDVDTNMQEFEPESGIFAYRTSKTTRLKCGIENITAWDYTIYSQILLSEEISVLIGGAYESAKLVKQKIQNAVNFEGNTNFYVELIIEEND